MTDKSTMVFFGFMFAIVIAVMVSLGVALRQDSPAPVQVTAAASVDRYIIINIRLTDDGTKTGSYLLDYAKNGEPLTAWLPSAEAVELYIARLGTLGDVVELSEPIK